MHSRVVSHWNTHTVHAVGIDMPIRTITFHTMLHTIITNSELSSS